MHLEPYEHAEESDYGSLLKSVLIGALLGGAFHFLFNRTEKRMLPHDVPPIGFISDPNNRESIIIETNDSLEDSGRSLARKTYTMSRSYRITDVVVLVRNIQTGQTFEGPSYPHGHRRVDFWLQSRDRDGNWVPDFGQLGDPDIIFRSDSGVTTIECEQFQRRNTRRPDHPDRKFTHALKGNENWRFGQIRFYGYNQNVVYARTNNQALGAIFWTPDHD